ncbi:Crp/Fnr family transcriptional regulator [Sphingobacterium prati]|uniref:Crp/Fnr family transcriptional regulator n=1 Tax=Sphingobacterium prati TaxID=2737006 RepID=UPI001553BD67|nr:Crp/Fnr family transcriptional regulator [Sphingobacterium prati]NPE46227.1 Crp/Fnr family transcriptional regulator [Sphingobacterium prati]
MDSLIDYILRFGDLNTSEIASIKASATQIELKKGEYFSEAGAVPRQVGFVVQGVLRGCYYNQAGEDITRCFIAEDSLAADYLNLESHQISTEYIQACTDCKLIVFSKAQWEGLSHTVAAWDTIKNKMVQLCMYQKSRKGPVVSQDASSRYLEFLKNYPDVMLRVPLRYIASYLGVTQQSLSRIRKNIT